MLRQEIKIPWLRNHIESGNTQPFNSMCQTDPRLIKIRGRYHSVSDFYYVTIN
ncbi:hypothetical protein KoxyNG13_010980 [Klebsiella pasteurii]